MLAQTLKPLTIRSFEITLEGTLGAHMPEVHDNGARAALAWGDFSRIIAATLSTPPERPQPASVHINLGTFEEIELGSEWDVDFDPFREQAQEAFGVLCGDLAEWRKGIVSLSMLLEALRSRRRPLEICAEVGDA